MANVLLLRAPSSEGPDKYEGAFRQAGYSAVSVPVLETVLVNLEKLSSTVDSGPSRDGLGGVIVTSARACEAWASVVQTLVGRDVPSTADWSTVPFYVVGAATASALSDISKVSGSTALAPKDTRGATESGTSEKLAQFILSDLPSSGSHPRKLLYLTGDKNRDTLPNILKDGGVELVSLQVYATQGSSTFSRDLERELRARTDETQWWIVFFAPSAAEFVTPTLLQHFALPSTDGSDEDTPAKRVAHIAAIGPTTSTFLRDSLHLTVAVLSPKPSAESLVGAIAAFDREHQ